MPIYKMSGKKDGKQRYRVRVNYVDAAGKARQTERVEYGLEAAKRLERELAQDIKSTSPERRMTIQQLYDEYIKAKQYEVKASTLDKSKRTLEYHILPELGGNRLDKFDLRQAQKWKLTVEEKATEAGEPLKPKTKQNIQKEFSAMMNYAVKMEYISKNPLKQLTRFKSPDAIETGIQYYTANEFKQFISAAESCAQEADSLAEWGYYIFFMLAFYTGMRKGEIHALCWADIAGEHVTVSRSLTQKLKGDDVEGPPKNRSSVRTLQMPRPLTEALQGHRGRCEAMEGFTEQYKICGGPKALRDTSIQLRNAKYAALAAVKTIRIHDFRHSHASLLANEGINIQEIARRLGHAKIEETWNTYAHLYPREEERAIAILNKIV